MQSVDFRKLEKADLSQTLVNASDFMSCFHLINEIELSSVNGFNHNVKLFSLNNNKMHFEYDALINALRNTIVNYVFNRKKVRDYKDKNQIQVGVYEAMEKLVSIDENALSKKNFGSGGELGEILLYGFLESFQKAFKLLSKVEIKTNNDLFANGFDGVHFFKKKYEDYTAYQTIFCEAKIKKDLKEAIKDAFSSLEKSYNKKATDLNLLDSLIFNEIVDDDIETIEFLKSILIPKYRSPNASIETEEAFAVFLGYSFTPPKPESGIPKNLLYNKVSKDFNDEIENITKQINAFNLTNARDFYIFILPFNDAVKDKHEIMLKIAGVKKWD